MTPNLPRQLQAIAYDREADAYLRSLPLEHFMEATDQANQRRITLASLTLVEARRSDFHVFNELLIQYPLPHRRKPGQVVPDNMVVRTSERIRARKSYNVPLEPEPPFWVLEYVSQGNPRKDYDESFRKYERDLKVPYYLIFHPENHELTLYRHNRRRYVSVKPNEHGRYPIQELELEVGLVDGWVRFWFLGQLLPLPEELQSDLEATRRRADEEKRRADEAQHRFDEETLLVEDLQRQLEAAKRQLAKLGH